MDKNDDLLMGFKLGVIEQNLNIYGIIVRQHGEITAEHRWRSDDDVELYSASKTFMSMAAGIAMSEGYFKLSDKVVNFFPEYVPENPDEKLLRMTVKNLLTMATGHACCPIMKAFGSGLEPVDWVKVFFDEPLMYEPGTHFVYNNCATYMISAIIRKTTGLNAREFLIPRVFTPLHIFNPQWDICPRGITQGFKGLHLTTEKFSRFGQLLLNRGEWNGKQLIPASYVDEATSKQIDNSDLHEWWATADSNSGYGYQMWINSYPNSYRMDGLYGQYSIGLPDKDAVVTITAHQEGKMLNIVQLVWDTLVYKL